MSHIYSAYRLLITCVYVHVRKGARDVLGKPVTVIVNHFPSAKLRRKKSHCKKNHENHTVLVSPFSEN